MKLGILADDLTGAGDVGGCFAQAGFRTVIALPFQRQAGTCLKRLTSSPEVSLNTTLTDLSAPLDGAEILIVDTESRYESPWVAAARVEEGFEMLAHWGANFFYKKIDSALRGNIGVELDAFLQSLMTRRSLELSEGNIRFPFFCLPMITAYPIAGRQTIDGSQFIDGVRLDQSSFAYDPRGGVREAHIPTLLKRTCRAWPFFKV